MTTEGEQDQQKPKLDWPENQVLLLVDIDDEAGWIGRVPGERWLRAKTRVSEVSIAKSDPYWAWVYSLQAVLRELTGAYSTATDWIDTESGKRRMLVAAPFGGVLTKQHRMPRSWRILQRARSASSTGFAVGVPSDLIVKTIQDLDAADFILTLAIRHYHYKEQVYKAFYDAKTQIEEVL